jgi:hypothetical protein
MTNLYVVGGAVAAFALYTFGVYEYGSHVENLSWEVTIGAQKVSAANVLTDATKKVADAQHQVDVINTNTEASNAKYVQQLADAKSENDRLAAQLNGLLQSAAGSRSGSTSPVPSNSRTSSVNSDVSAAYTRAAGLMADLLTHGNQLDAAYREQAAAAVLCHDWALSVSAVH